MNNKELITFEEYCSALKKSWDVTLDQNACFPEEISVWMSKKCTELGVPFTYMGYPFLSMISYCLGVSLVKVSKRYKEPVIIYTLVSGRSGTNKSGSLSSIQSLLNVLSENDSEEGVEEETKRQHLFDSGTMEGLMTTLKKNDGPVLCAVDEFSTFLDNMDKNCSGMAERYRYLSLWSGSSWTKTTKQSGEVKIQYPRFNFTSFNQNYFLINMLLKSSHYDGFLPRFLVATPDEVFVKLGEKINASRKRDNIDMTQLVKIIYGHFYEGCVFDLSKEALILVMKYHDDDVLVPRMEDRFDDTKSTVLSKSMSNVLRVAAVQCALRFGITTLLNPLNLTQNETQNETQQPEDVTEEDIFSEETVATSLIELSDGEFVSQIEDESNEEVPDDEKNKIKMTITEKDMESALHIVRYSVRCVLTLLNSAKKAKSSTPKGKTGKVVGVKRSLPESAVIDREFLYLNRSKVQKLFQQDTNGTNRVPFSKITKDHLYPQIGRASGSEFAKKFIVGLEINGLGQYCEEDKYFQLLDIEDTENMSEDVLKFIKDLGLRKQ